MTTQKSLQVNSLDFDQIKLGIKGFLNDQTVFKDYDFEGSGLSVLLDVLSYVTYYQGIYNHLASNELFLDTATKRSSVVSHAKSLGYSPRSRTAANAIVDFSTTSAGSYIRRGSIFKARQDDVSYTFLNTEDVTLVNGAVTDLKIREGQLKSKSFIVPNNKTNQSFVLDDINVDTDTIKVTVQRSVSDSTGISDVWSNASSIVSVDEDTLAYFVEETYDEYPSVSFGNGVIGKKLQAGNYVTVSYLVTSGSAANGIGSNDSASTRTFNFDSNSTVEVKTQASGGSQRESLESIRFNAPKSYTSQNRAVTQSDFESLVRSNFSGFDSVYTYGGEQATPPQYGKVYVALKPTEGTVITTGLRNDIATFLKKRTSVALMPEVIESSPLYVLANTSIFFDPAKTPLNETILKASIEQTINRYISQRTRAFNTVLAGSLVENDILQNYDTLTTAITSLRVETRLSPNPIQTEYTLDFKNECEHPHPGHISIFSSNLINYTDSVGNLFSGFFDDDGRGRIRFYSIVNGQRVYRNTNLGTINYRTGVVSIRPIILNLGAGQTDMRFRVVTRFSRAVSRELFTLSFDPAYELSNQVTLYNQNLVPPPTPGEVFITVSGSGAIPSVDAQFSQEGIPSSGSALPSTTSTPTNVPVDPSDVSASQSSGIFSNQQVQTPSPFGY